MKKHSLLSSQNIKVRLTLRQMKYVYLSFIMLTVLACKPTQIPQQNSSTSTTCTDEDLELYAQNYRRILLKDLKFTIEDYNDFFASSIDSLTDQDIKDVLEKLQSQNRKYKYQTPLVSGMLKYLKSTVEEFVELDVAKRPIISSKLTFAPNAEILKFPSEDCDRRIIFINEGVILHFYQIAQSLLNIIAEDVLIQPKFELKNQEEYFSNNRELIFQGFLNLWQFEISEGNLDQIAFDYVYAVFYFLIAHEYAHDVLNHKGILKAYSIEKHDDSEAMNVNKITYNWAQELEADFFATNILLDIANSNKDDFPLNHLYIWGGEYFCTFIDYHIFSENYFSLEQNAQKKISDIRSSTNNEVEKEKKLVNLYTKLFSRMKTYANAEIPKLKYTDLDSLVILINEKLPEEPVINDFQKVLIDLKLFPKEESSSHPPTYLRRAFCRVSILKNSNLSSLVKDNRNHGDLYWKYFTAMYFVLKDIANKTVVDEQFIKRLLEKK